MGSNERLAVDASVTRNGDRIGLRPDRWRFDGQRDLVVEVEGQALATAAFRLSIRRSRFPLRVDLRQPGGSRSSATSGRSPTAAFRRLVCWDGLVSRRHYGFTHAARPEMNESPFQGKMPRPLPALLWSVAMVLLAAPAYFSGEWWGLVVATPCLAVAAFLWLSVLAPGRFLAGVQRVPGGLEVRSPLRRSRTIYFADICRIVAVSLNDGDTGEPVVNLLVCTRSASALLEEHVLLEHALLADLQTLPCFNRTEYERALQHTPSDFREPFGKRFTMLSVP